MEKKEINITEKVKSFEDAQKLIGRPDVPDFSNVPEDMREYFENQYKIIVIAEALNESWKADYNDGNQRKWFPWFYTSSSGFAFDGTYCHFSAPDAGNSVRLCFKSDELATYAGEQFKDIWEKIILK